MVKNKRYYSQSQKYKNGAFRQRALLVVVICLFIGAGYFGFKQISNRGERESASNASVNLEPPTAADKKETEENKDRLAESKDEQTANSNSTPDTAGSSKKNVTPTITDASRTSVRAYVNGIFEEDGLCTATFTKDGQTLTKTSTGFQNSSYTQCAPINYDSNFLSSGKWSVTVTYTSANAEGISAVSHIE